MFAHQQSKIGVLRVAGRILKAVAVHGYNTVGILADNGSVGIHAEGANKVLKFFRTVNNLAFI